MDKKSNSFATPSVKRVLSIVLSMFDTNGRSNRQIRLSDWAHKQREIVKNTQYIDMPIYIQLKLQFAHRQNRCFSLLSWVFRCFFQHKHCAASQSLKIVCVNEIQKSNENMSTRFNGFTPDDIVTINSKTDLGKLHSFISRIFFLSLRLSVSDVPTHVYYYYSYWRCQRACVSIVFN